MSLGGQAGIKIEAEMKVEVSTGIVELQDTTCISTLRLYWTLTCHHWLLVHNVVEISSGPKPLHGEKSLFEPLRANMWGTGWLESHHLGKPVPTDPRLRLPPLVLCGCFVKTLNCQILTLAGTRLWHESSCLDTSVKLVVGSTLGQDTMFWLSKLSFLSSASRCSEMTTFLATTRTATSSYFIDDNQQSIGRYKDSACVKNHVMPNACFFYNCLKVRSVFML